MMHFYELKTNLAGSAEQPKLLELLQRNKIEFIQTASGLCVKSRASQREIETMMAEAVIDTAFAVFEIHPSGDYSPDMQAFLKT